MKRAVIFWLVASCLPAMAAGGDEPTPTTIDDFAWVAGHWRTAEGATLVEEAWLYPAGGTMLGVNRTIAGEKTVAFEYLRLEADDQGVRLLASPGGRSPATAFTLIEFEHQRAVFENPDHVFPQRVVYRREGNRLHAAIEGTRDGEPARIDWVFERQP